MVFLIPVAALTMAKLATIASIAASSTVVAKSTYDICKKIKEGK